MSSTFFLRAGVQRAVCPVLVALLAVLAITQGAAAAHRFVRRFDETSGRGAPRLCR